MLFLPVRICIKNTGPFDSSLINMASMGYSQLKTKKMINNENRISNNLLKNLLNMLLMGLMTHKHYAGIL
jgi:hypothetical protein